MTPQIALTLSIIAVAVILFATEKIRADVVALLVLLTLVLTGLLDSGQAFSGFASPAVVTVWAVYIVSGGLFKTGVADVLGERIIRLAGNSEPRLVAILMITCGLMSAFMNNIGATAILLPAVMGISRQSRIPASRLLIPLAFSSLLGGNMTLIGTPPNVLAASILAERGAQPFGFFDFTPTGLVVFGVGILYMVFIGRHLLPVREQVEGLPQVHLLREYISEVRVLPDSPLAGKTLVESRLGADYDLTILAIVRDGRTQTALHSQTHIQPGDLLIAEGSIEDLMQAHKTLGLAIEAEPSLELTDLDTGRMCIIEATLAPRSRMIGRTLAEARLREQFGFTALAIWRQGEVITRRLRDVPLRFGDALLLYGPRHRVAALGESGGFLVLEPVQIETRRTHKAPLALAALGLALGLVIVADFSISVAMVIGAVLMVLTGCLSMDEAYHSIEWRSIFLISGMLPLGLVMDSTGTARFLSDLITGTIGGLGPLGILAGVYILASLLTEFMSNAAATVLVVPIAIDTALGLGASPHAYVLATVIGSSTSFLTPVGHQANVLVFGPGGYRFFDYTRVGGPLYFLILGATLVVLPLLWPLVP